MHTEALAALTIIPRVPEPGECFFSLDLSKVDSIKQAVESAFLLGFKPCLAICQLQTDYEIHLLLARWVEPDLSGNPTLFLTEADQLAEQFNPEAVRYTWCNTRAVVAA